MMSFESVFPKLAQDECRVIRAIHHHALKPGTYQFREFYCEEPACDCRRVILRVLWAEGGRTVATINYAFDPPKPPFEDEELIFLDPINPQSEMSEGLLDMFKKMIATDQPYHNRLVSHYEMWKQVVDDSNHPDHGKVRSMLHDDPTFRPAFPRAEPVRREKPKIGANAPCPCGSGMKYKRCCWA
jgi:hypothetical protein